MQTSANYTEFLRDYLKTNTLPASLHDADEAFGIDFAETFKNYYLMREIGFHTEEMFTQKLSVQIDIMLPYYKQKAEALKTLYENITNTSFEILQTNNLSNDIKNEVTTDTRLDYNTPAGSVEKVLPVTALAGGSENTNTRNGKQTNTGTIKTHYDKNPRANNAELLKTFNEEFKNIVVECLKSFDCLFMQIF
jgi:site-specific DNA-adenine methylase